MKTFRFCLLLLMDFDKIVVLVKNRHLMFWGLKACLSQTGQGFGACVHEGLFKRFGGSRQAGQSFGSEGLLPLATSTIYIGEFKPKKFDPFT